MLVPVELMQQNEAVRTHAITLCNKNSLHYIFKYILIFTQKTFTKPNSTTNRHKETCYRQLARRKVFFWQANGGFFPASSLFSVSTAKKTPH
jgi:hypothetical protein